MAKHTIRLKGYLASDRYGQVRREIQIALAERKDILLIIDSPGGDVSAEFFKLIGLIRNNRPKVFAHAACDIKSAASFIFAACGKRVVYQCKSSIPTRKGGHNSLCGIMLHGTRISLPVSALSDTGQLPPALLKEAQANQRRLAQILRWATKMPEPLIQVVLQSGSAIFPPSEALKYSIADLCR